MKNKNADIRCKVCLRWHSPTHMCAPARRVLDALAEQGTRFDMPTVEFPEPVSAPMAVEPGDKMMRQLVVMAGVINAGHGVHVGALVFTGQDSEGKPLPQWILPADDADLDRAVKLVAEVADMAKRAAEKAREAA